MKEGQSTNISRRHLLKKALITSSALGLSPLTGCFKQTQSEGFDIYWLHWEGAPLRSLFDLWIDPYNHHAEISSSFKTQNYQRYNQKLSLPEVWFKNGEASPILENLLSIRGLSTKSPHLKQCRHEWFSKEFLSQIEKENQGKERSPLLSWTCSDERLYKSYKPLFRSERIPPPPPPTKGNGPMDFFQVWKNESARKLEPRLHIALTNQYANGLYFENLTQIREEDSIKLQTYYRSLILNLENFVDYLKKRGLFQKSVILLTSDRARIPTNQSFPMRTESLWQGLNMSLISGAISGPVVLGHIAKEHPKYKESYPGTWGYGLSHWTPGHVHQLVADLCWSKRYTDSKNWVSPNPWIDRKPFHRFYIKKGIGQIINT